MAFTNVFNPKALATLAAAITVSTAGVANAQAVQQEDGSIKTSLDQAKEALASGGLVSPNAAKTSTFNVSLGDYNGTCTVSITGMTGRVLNSNLTMTFNHDYTTALIQNGKMIYNVTTENGAPAFHNMTPTGESMPGEDSVNLPAKLAAGKIFCMEARMVQWVTPAPTK